MKKQQMFRLMQTMSASDLQSLVPMKVKMEGLESKKATLERELSVVSRQIMLLQGSLGKAGGRKTPIKVKVKPKGAVGIPRRRIEQPSLASVVVGILKAKKGPAKVNDICEAVLTEWKYKTNSKNFKGQLRILLYRNEKGLFEKVGPGLFALAKSKEKAADRPRRA